MVAAAVASLLAVPGGAGAAVTCDLSSGVLDVGLTANDDAVRISVSAGAINFTNRGGAPLACTGGSPTVNNTNSISIHNSLGQTNNDVTIADVGSYGPGSIAEAGDDEIEIFVNLNGVSESELTLVTSALGDDVTLGTGGINPNAAAGEDQPDTDITHNNTSSVLRVTGAGGPDAITAQGGSGSGNPVTRALELSGGGGNDVVSGGNGPDVVMGNPGQDGVHGFGGDDFIDAGNGTNLALTGGDGDDDISPGSSTDPVDAGPGEDTLHYSTAGTGVTADMEGKNAEILNGTTGADVLRGDGGPNVINGFDGNDDIDGRGGADTIDAGSGDDSVQARDGVGDSGTCGLDADTLTADVAGVDLLNDCETEIFPPAPADPGTGAPGGGAPGGGAPGLGAGSGPGAGGPVVPTSAFGARTLVTLSLAGGRIPARGPIAVRVANANGFAVRGILGGQTTQRLRASGQRKRRVRLKAKSFTVGANARRTLRLKLPSRLRHELARKGKLSLRLSATVRDPAGSSRTVRKTVAPRLRP